MQPFWTSGLHTDLSLLYIVFTPSFVVWTSLEMPRETQLKMPSFNQFQFHHKSIKLTNLSKVGLNFKSVTEMLFHNGKFEDFHSKGIYFKTRSVDRGSIQPQYNPMNITEDLPTHNLFDFPRKEIRKYHIHFGHSVPLGMTSFPKWRMRKLVPGVFKGNGF